MAVVLAVSGVTGYLQGRHEVEELFDAALATSARVLRSLLDVGLAETAATQPPLVFETFHAFAGRSVGRPSADIVIDNEDALPWGHKYEKKLALQVWDATGRLLARSETAPDTRLAPLAAGYSNQRFGDHEWRVFTLHSGRRWYQVAERDDIRDELSREIAIQSLVPLLLGLPVLIGLVLVVIRRSLAPLEQLASDVGQREANQLDALATPKLPTELANIVNALNGLFGRLRRAFEREGRFAADAAHELRTPLAALSIHAHNALRAQTPEQARHSLNKMQAGLARTTHVVEQLLALSRIDPTAASGEWGDVGLCSVTEQIVTEMRPLADSKNLRLDCDCRSSVVVRGNKTLLQLLIRNILDNALRYTPSGGRIALAVDSDSRGVNLFIADTGPGVPEELRSRVFDRFVRAPGQSAEGSGLGLSIARRIADLHDAVIDLGPNPDSPDAPGLRVTVRFPKSPPHR